MTINGITYVVGQDRNDSKAVAHLYEGHFDEPRNPMCARGWNRSNGYSYSIFRNNPSAPVCAICIKRARKGLPSVPAKRRRTKWI